MCDMIGVAGLETLDDYRMLLAEEMNNDTNSPQSVVRVTCPYYAVTASHCWDCKLALPPRYQTSPLTWWGIFGRGRETTRCYQHPSPLLSIPSKRSGPVCSAQASLLHPVRSEAQELPGLLPRFLSCREIIQRNHSRLNKKLEYQSSQ